MTVRGVSTALAEDVETCHVDGCANTRAWAPGRFRRHTLRVILPSVAMCGKGLSNVPVDLAICRAEERCGGAGDREMVQKFSTIRGCPRFDCFSPVAVYGCVSLRFEEGYRKVEDGGAFDACFSCHIRSLVPNDSSMTRGPFQRNLDRREIRKDLRDPTNE